MSKALSRLGPRMKGFNCSCPALSLADAYLTAKEVVISSGYAFEVDWQHDVSFSVLCESVFLREMAWVVLSAGMKESVIRVKFSAISSAFLDWKDAKSITLRRKECMRSAIDVFSHHRKMSAILDIATEVHSRGFEFVKQHLVHNPIEYIRT